MLTVSRPSQFSRMPQEKEGFRWEEQEQSLQDLGECVAPTTQKVTAVGSSGRSKDSCLGLGT